MKTLTSNEHLDNGKYCQISLSNPKNSHNNFLDFQDYLKLKN